MVKVIAQIISNRAVGWSHDHFCPCLVNLGRSGTSWEEGWMGQRHPALDQVGEGLCHRYACLYMHVYDAQSVAYVAIMLLARHDSIVSLY